MRDVVSLLSAMASECTLSISAAYQIESICITILYPYRIQGRPIVYTLLVVHYHNTLMYLILYSADILKLIRVKHIGKCRDTLPILNDVHFYVYYHYRSS